MGVFFKQHYPDMLSGAKSAEEQKSIVYNLLIKSYLRNQKGDAVDVIDVIDQDDFL